MTQPFRGKSAARQKQSRSGRSGVSARWLAFRALRGFQQRGVYVSRVLDDLFQEQNVDPRERRLATDLAATTARRQLTFDTILSGYVQRPRDEVDDDIWAVLQLGCCQLLCLPHIPPHAAVNETVALCQRLRKPQARGFVNGILRSLVRETSHAPVQPLGLVQQWDFAGSVSPTRFPLLELHEEEPSLQIVDIQRAVFADPAASTAASLAQATSLPEWLIERWQQQFPLENSVAGTALWMSMPGRMWLRVNLQQASREQVLEVLSAADVLADAGDLPEAIALRGSVHVTDLPGFRDGWFSVQDISAMSAVDLLNPQPGERILDLCAAPGGKACHLAERLAGTGQVIACDIARARVEAIQQNITRLRLTNIQTEVITPDFSTGPTDLYDAVLVDVPCSNTGVLGKRPEARWRLTPDSFSELIPMQLELVRQAVVRTRPGGRIVYSTCSIDREENQNVVAAVLSEQQGVTLLEERAHWPGAPSDGGYQALLVKDSSPFAQNG